MNQHVRAELRRLKVHLQRHPQQAEQLAIAHFEDYWFLLNECRHLQAQIKLLRQDRTALISPNRFINTRLTLVQQFHVEKLKRNLASKPHQNFAQFWALKYFKHFLLLGELYRQKKVELLCLCRPQSKPQLPHFL